MKMLRRVLFWMHLVSGVVAGVVVLIMSITGVALTYEKQLIEWADRDIRSLPPSAGADRLSLETLLGQVERDHPHVRVTGLTLAARPDAPVVVAAEPTPLLVDAYSGRSLG